MNKRFLAACLAVVVVTSIVFADMVETGYRQLRGTAPASVAAQTSATAAQSSDWTTTPIAPKAVNGNPKVIVEGKFSGSAAPTCVVWVGRYFRNADGTYKLLGVKSGTLTGSTTETDGLLGTAKFYLATSFLEFDTQGATHYDCRMAAPSTGSVTLTHYVVGCSKRSDE